MSSPGIPNLGVDNEAMPGTPDVGRYRMDFNGTPICVCDVTEAGDIELVEVLDQKLYDLMPKSKYASEIPATFYNMHPDLGMFGKLLGIETKGELFDNPRDHKKRGIRCLSGFRIMPMVDGLSQEFATQGQELDFLRAPIAESCDELGTFTGALNGPRGVAGTPEFNALLQSKWVGKFDHRFSGKQTKIPGRYASGTLGPSESGRSMTHLIKYPSANGREADGLLEWAGLRMAQAAGLPINKYAVLDQGHDLPPAIAVERFDIPQNADALNDEWILMQDMYSIIGEDPRLDDEEERKKRGMGGTTMFRYEDILEGFIKFCQKHDPDNVQKNVRDFLTRVVTSWAGNDADLHAKNMSVIIRIDPNTKAIRSVEMSPAYDVCPSTVCGTDGEPMIYNLNKVKGKPFEGKPPRTLNMNQWMDFFQSQKISVDGKPFCIFDTRAEAEGFVRDITSKVAHSAVDSFLNVPSFVHDLKDGSMLMLDMQLLAKISCGRAKSIGADVPDIDFDPDLGKIVKRCGAKARKTAFDKTGVSAMYSELAALAVERASGLTVNVGGGFMPVNAAAAVYSPPTQ